MLSLSKHESDRTSGMTDATPSRAPVLPDVLAPGLRLVFCGSAAGRKSAELGAYYAGPGNKSWPTLYEIGLTPRHFRPPEFRELRTLGIGPPPLPKRSQER